MMTMMMIQKWTIYRSIFRSVLESHLDLDLHCFQANSDLPLIENLCNQRVLTFRSNFRYWDEDQDDKLVPHHFENRFTLQWIRSILKRWRGRFCDWTKRAIEARLLDIVYVYKALCRSFYNIGALLSRTKLLSIVLKTILRVRMPMTLQFWIN